MDIAIVAALPPLFFSIALSNIQTIKQLLGSLYRVFYA